MYDAFARERRAPEPPKRAGAGRVERSEFERDRARVLHSYAFRRLAAKTQVVVPGEDDFPRTRLTHSLEVAQISREMGAALGCDPDVVDAAGLAHDLGHPPFGHNGEEALDSVASSIGGFEGNAQTLRILTRLEVKIEGGGLNLTRATLDAVCKYPWPRSDGQRKYGVYESDTAAFSWLRSGVPDGRRCLEAQVMDWADDVAYSVHDLEDGVHGGHIDMASLDDAERSSLCSLAASLYSPLSASELAPVLDSLLALPTVGELTGYDGSHRAQAAAKRATSELTGRFVGAAVLATQEKYGVEPLNRYDADLVVPTDVAAECALLKAVAARYVMHRHGAIERQSGERQLLRELVAAVADGAPGTLDPTLSPSWLAASSDEDRLRVVIDQVSKLTDIAAVAWHARLVRPR